MFMLNVNQHVDAAFGLELSVPQFVADKPAIGAKGKMCDSYGEFAEESRLLAKLVLDIFAEESKLKPLLNPKLIITVNDETLKDENARAILLKAHGLAAEKGTPYFASVPPKGKTATFSVSGCKFETDLSGDWETDTLRAGCIGYVTVNLPRLVHESEKNKSKFFELLRERCEMASRALIIKHRALRQHGRSAFPFLAQSTNGDTYFRLENCSGVINLAGFNECVESFSGKPVSSEEGGKFAEEITQNVLSFKHKVGRRYGKRLFTTLLRSAEASERLAQLDIEKYGVAKMRFSGTRDKPFYATTRRLALQEGSVAAEALAVEHKVKGLNVGGSLNIIDLDEKPYTAEELLKVTTQLVGKHAVEFFTYDRKITYCRNCEKSLFGMLHKCPSCGAMSTLIKFGRFSAT